jgi:regulator of cell morphogenesis and NO signaling
MFLQPRKINSALSVSDIVAGDYRTADVFRKYGIEYCCGGKLPLHQACEMKQVDEKKIVAELEEAARDTNTSTGHEYNEWHVDFLTDYIVNIHHHYLRIALPSLKDYVDRFAASHRDKFPYLDELQKLVNQLVKNLLPHLDQEEEIIFPYVRQIGHAYDSRESYASLLVRTLRKPVEDIMQHEHETVGKILRRLREITTNYTPPTSACISHKVTFSKLKEVDCDMVQHLHLENNILFPKAIAMEKELLKIKD